MMLMHGNLWIASQFEQWFPGATELRRLMERGNAIFVRASFLAGGRGSRTDQTRLMLQEERIHLESDRLSPREWKAIVQILSQTNLAEVQNLKRLMMWEGYSSDDPDSIASELLSRLLMFETTPSGGFVLAHHYSPTKNDPIEKIIDRVFSNYPKLAEKIKTLRIKTYPFSYEKEIRTMRRSVRDSGIATPASRGDYKHILHDWFNGKNFPKDPEIKKRFAKIMRPVVKSLTEKGVRPRAEVRKIEAELLRRRSEPTSLATIIRTATEPLGGLFEKMDAKVLAANLEVLNHHFGSLSEFLIPSAIAAPAPGTFGLIAERTQTVIAGRAASGIISRLSMNTQSNGTVGYLVGLETFKKYGLVLAALQNQHSEFRFAVIAEGTSEERAVQKGIVQELNRKLRPGSAQILVYDNPVQAALGFRKQVSSMEGIGLKPQDVAAIVNLIPNFATQGEKQLGDMVAVVPGVEALLAEFNSAFQRALESAA